MQTITSVENQTQIRTSYIRELYAIVRARTEEICSHLKTEDFVVQPIVDVSPPKWHLGHTTWFFETFVLSQNKSYQNYHKDFSFLFNSYYESVGERVFRADRGNMTRPELSEVYAYRKYVDNDITEFFNHDHISGEILDVIELGLHHEMQHQELLLTDIKYILGHNPLFPAYKNESSIDQIDSLPDDPGFVSMEGGIYEMGFNGDGFHFDNELGNHKVYLESYQISKSPVTCGEFIEFMEDGGYENFKYWHSDAWAWVKENEISGPEYFHKIHGDWHRYTLSGLERVNPKEILLHVSYYEAYAFANWKGMRLPTEFEWEAAADKFQWGDCWEWTNSAYLPYPRFEIAPGAIGEYNGKFMVNQMVLRGSSRATASNHSRKTYRNFFHPQLQWQYSGIRLAK